MGRKKTKINEKNSAEISSPKPDQTETEYIPKTAAPAGYADRAAKREAIQRQMESDSE